MARERHVDALRKALTHIGRCCPALLITLRWNFSLKNFALGMKRSARSGEFTADDLLGEIFSRFCIGGESKLPPRGRFPC